jgi:hypothetical protein
VGSPTEPPTTAEVLTGILLDEMYPPALAQRLRAAGHDVLAALDVEVGLASRSDEDVLAWAARNNRCVTHAGIVLVSARRFPRTANGRLRLSNALDSLIAAKGLPPPGGVIWLSAHH